MSNPTFQHRHYKAIADVLADLHIETSSASFAGSVPMYKVEEAFVRLFSADNYGFSEDRFIKAARRDPKMHGKDKVQ